VSPPLGDRAGAIAGIRHRWQVLALTAVVIAGLASANDTLRPPAVTGSRSAPVASWGTPLPYPVIIADRGNNRLVEVTPDKRIVWEFRSPDLKIYHGNDDVYFSPDGRLLAISEEDNYDIHLIDYEKRQLVWTYGVPDQKGSAPGYLDYPDDTHLLPDGTVVVADIRNCRILFIDRTTNRVVSRWGEPRRCRHDPPHALDLPNGVTPLQSGDLLVTEIRGRWISRLTRTGAIVWSVRAPHVSYPSDAFPTRDGQVIVADYTKPGRVVIFDPVTRRVTWEYAVRTGEKMLDHPSLAMELPNGDVILTDDLRHRVIVVDRKTKDIVWQYGVTDQKGIGPGFLDHPDGLDIDVFHDWKRAAAEREGSRRRE
jgi:hypothetical protein